jgi:hypothetical protein
VIPPDAGGEASATPGLEPRLARLGDLIEKFRIEAERYFNGAAPIPPEQLRNRIQRALRDLRTVVLKSAVDQFRLAGLEARFNVLSENFGRRLRDREEGRGPVRPRETGDTGEQYDPEEGIVLGAKPEPAAVDALFAGLAKNGAAANLDLDAFRGYLAHQVEEIRARTGAEKVQFRLAREQGKIKLKAKPIGSSEAEG